MLRQLFEPHAKVIHSAVITEPGSGISKGFGFIHIPDPAQVRGGAGNYMRRQRLWPGGLVTRSSVRSGVYITQKAGCWHLDIGWGNR